MPPQSAVHRPRISEPPMSTERLREMIDEEMHRRLPEGHVWVMLREDQVVRLRDAGQQDAVRGADRVLNRYVARFPPAPILVSAASFGKVFLAALVALGVWSLARAAVGLPF